MDDEGGFSFDDIEEDTAVAPASAAAPAADTVSAAAAVVGSTVVEEASAEDHLPPPEDDGYRKPLVLYKHWVRYVLGTINFLRRFLINSKISDQSFCNTIICMITDTIIMMMLLITWIKDKRDSIVKFLERNHGQNVF